MSDDTLRPEDEYEVLKDRAKLLGINVGNSSLETLRKKVAAKQAGELLVAAPDEEDGPKETAVPVQRVRPKTKAEIEQEIRTRVQKKGLALVRCRIYNLDPSKRDLHGEFITVANRYLGTVKKFIPFGEATDNGYHIPYVIYTDLKNRKFQQKLTRKSKERPGEIIVERRMAPEYSIDVLPPLTRQELDELAVNQAAAQRLGV